MDKWRSADAGDADTTARGRPRAVVHASGSGRSSAVSDSSRKFLGSLL